MPPAVDQLQCPPGGLVHFLIHAMRSCRLTGPYVLPVHVLIKAGVGPLAPQLVRGNEQHGAAGQEVLVEPANGRVLLPEGWLVGEHVTTSSAVDCFHVIGGTFCQELVSGRMHVIKTHESKVRQRAHFLWIRLYICCISTKSRAGQGFFGDWVLLARSGGTHCRWYRQKRRVAG